MTANTTPQPVMILSDALERIIELNRQYCLDKYGDADKAETMSCVTLAREALRQAKDAEIAQPVAGISPDFRLPCEIKLPPATTIGKGCRLQTLMTALALDGRPERFGIPPTPEEVEQGNSLRALIQSAQAH